MKEKMFEKCERKRRDTKKTWENNEREKSGHLGGRGELRELDLQLAALLLVPDLLELLLDLLGLVRPVLLEE